MTHHVHHVPGRLRIRIPELKRNASLAHNLTTTVLGAPGVTSAEANLLTGSFLVYYDLRLTAAAPVLAVIDAQCPARVLPSSDVKDARPFPSQHPMSRKLADAVIRYALEKAIERSLPIVLGAFF